MASLKASGEGQAKITEARKKRGWRINATNTKPLKEASKVLLHRYGQENGWEDNDPQWLKELEKILRIGKKQDASEIRREIIRARRGSFRDRIEVFIEDAEIFAKDISYGSWSRFAGSKIQPIKERAFQAYCQILDLSWEEVVDREPSPPSHNVKRSQHNLPVPDHTAFIGRREELNKLLKLLSPDSAVYRISIEGEGGLGKTALALEAAYRCLHASWGVTTSPAPVFDAIIFVSSQPQRLTGTGILKRLRQEANQRDIFRAIARTLDLPELAYTALEERLERVQDYLSKQSTLLIIDNLETVEDRDTILALLYELPPTVKIIVTTRQPASSLVPIRLDSLAKEDALDLILHQVEEKGLDVSLEDAERLYKRTKGLPAAIVYTIGQRAAGSDIEEIIERLAQATNDVSRYCFEGSVKLLSESAHHLLMALAFFPQVALREAIAKVSSVEEPLILAKDLAHLQKLSLIKQKEERYTMLPATRSYVLAQLDDAPKFAPEARQRWLNWFLAYVRQYGHKTYRDWGDYDNLEGEWGNLSEAIEWCLGHEQYDLFKEFWLYLGGFTRFRGYWDEREAWLNCLLEAAIQQGDRATIARTLLDKVHTLTLTDRPGQGKEAIALCEEALTIPDGLEGRSRFDAMVHLAIMHLNEKQFSSAQKWLGNAQETIESTAIKEEDRLHLQTHLLYHQGQLEAETGNLQQARQLYEQCLKQAKQIDWQLGTIYTYGRLAVVEIEEGNLDEAERQAYCQE
ncbi:NB-ARC domain-containing protein [Spirulina sp. 06S082]|uniref:NB-ARC domain-containing protein n=1 Tax=Spirulina sp. 06S082 TaxID=3110248 RepID=UPI002B213078|nr:NB-ARC domain-containing protein [Spirulina sp. 06S082]MEA5472450.1 NB-ARC domain-containing protein [Spirulina sp. 06S082]